MTLIPIEFRPCYLDLRSIVVSEIKVCPGLLQATSGRKFLLPDYLRVEHFGLELVEEIVPKQDSLVTQRLELTLGTCHTSSFAR